MQQIQQLYSKSLYPTYAFGMVALVMFATGDSLHAQSTTSQILSNVQTQAIGTGYTIDSINQQTLGRDRATISGTIGTSINQSGRSVSKPFSNTHSRPTVSPYLNLFSDGLNNGADNYNTLVRPMINQQRANEQFRRQNDQFRRQEQTLNARFQSLSARPAFTPQGNQNILTTGHQTTFGYTSHYYPQTR